MTRESEVAEKFYRHAYISPEELGGLKWDSLVDGGDTWNLRGKKITLFCKAILEERFDLLEHLSRDGVQRLMQVANELGESMANVILNVAYDCRMHLSHFKQHLCFLFKNGLDIYSLYSYAIGDQMSVLEECLAKAKAEGAVFDDEDSGSDVESEPPTASAATAASISISAPTSDFGVPDNSTHDEDEPALHGLSGVVLGTGHFGCVAT